MRLNVHPGRYSAPLVVLLLASTGCSQSTEGWNGNWKLNPVKSHVQGGAYITISTLPNEMIRLTNDAFNFDFRCNGREYPNPNGKDLTTSCIQANATQWKLTYRRNGTMTTEALWSFSEDFDTLTIQAKSMQPDGSSKAHEHVYHRQGEGAGIAGRWQESDPLGSRPMLMSLSLHGKLLRLAYPETGQFVEAPLDGASAPLNAPHARQGFSMSVRIDGPQLIHTQISFEGRAIREGTLRLDEDKRTLFAESWVPGHVDEKDLLVYEKQ